MKLATSINLEDRKADPSLTERVQRRCQLAKELEKAGDYEAAVESLKEFWPEIETFRLEGLDPLSTAEVLLRIGALTGWIGDARQLNGSQEMAKNLITRSMDVFERLGQPS